MPSPESEVFNSPAIYYNSAFWILHGVRWFYLQHVSINRLIRRALETWVVERYRFVGGVEAKSSSKWRANHTRQSETLLSASLSADLTAIEDSGEIKAMARNLAGEVVSSASLIVNSKHTLKVILEVA